ncbi:MAG: hypothetical protein GY715_15385 [Planctomycetes bacterium]|nr:hypothetical protein [Planctomycetota bacterium]
MRTQGLVVAMIVAALGGASSAMADSSESTRTPKDVLQQQRHDMVNAAMGLARSELIPIDEPEHSVGDPLMLVVPIAGRAWALDLEPHSMRSPDYRLYSSDAPRDLVALEPGTVTTLRGVVVQDEGSTIAASMTAHGFRGVVQFSDGERWWIEPVSGIVDGLGDDVHVVYHESDVLPHEGICAVNDVQLARERLDRLPHSTPEEGGADGSTPDLSIAEHACDADFEYYVDWGSSVLNVEDRINDVINAVNLQYESEVGIRHVISAIIVRTSPFYPSTQHNTLLGQFRSQWLNNHPDIPRDVTQLFTGKELDGSVIGVAWTLGGICTTSAYCLSQSDFSGNFNCATDLSAHELGHLWDASHCSCPSFTMNPSITCANQFTQGTINSIVAHRDSRDCLGLFYCEAFGNNDNFEYISNVTIGTLTNDSGPAGYSDFSGLSQSVQIGDSIDLTMTVGNSNSSDVGGLWVDWNRDGDFTDPSEAITTSWSGHGPHVATINVPPWAVLGRTRARMRIQRGSQDPVPDPCGSTSRGEVEDYELKLLPPTPPPNDDCTTPIVIGVDPVAFTTVGATTDGPFEPQLCNAKGDQNIESDIWFQFTAPCGGSFTASLCGSNYDTRVGVYQACPTGSLEILACNDDACGQQSIVTFTGFKDAVFLIRVGGYFGERGDGTLSMSVECLDEGGCCLADGVCSLLNPGNCVAAGGTFNGIGTDCVPNPCVQPGACCFGDGSCTEVQGADCSAAGGTYQGDDTNCVSAKCPQPSTGACCATGGGCSVETEADCTASGGSYVGDDSPCDPGTCALPCPVDLDDSGDVGFGDILQVIGAWGPCGVPCPEDLDSSGDVGFGDILQVIGAWGPCP